MTLFGTTLAAVSLLGFTKPLPPCCMNGTVHDSGMAVTIWWEVDPGSVTLTACSASGDSEAASIATEFTTGTIDCGGGDENPPETCLDADGDVAWLYPSVVPAGGVSSYASCPQDGGPLAGIASAEAAVIIPNAFGGTQYVSTFQRDLHADVGLPVGTGCEIHGNIDRHGSAGGATRASETWTGDLDGIDMIVHIGVNGGTGTTSVPGFPVSPSRSVIFHRIRLTDENANTQDISGLLSPNGAGDIIRLGIFAAEDFDPSISGDDFEIDADVGVQVLVQEGIESLTLTTTQDVFATGTPDLNDDGILCMDDWRAFFDAEGSELNDSNYNPRADFDLDGDVDSDDWDLFIAVGCTGDYNCDGNLDSFDVGDFSNNLDLDLNRDGNIDGFDIQYIEQIVGSLDCSW